MSRYTFHDPSTPSFAEIANCITSDGALDSGQRNKLTVALAELLNIARKVPRFRTLDADTLPFTRDVVAGLIEVLEAAAPNEKRRLGISCQSILGRYGLAHPPRWAPYTPAVTELLDRLPETYRRRNIDRLLRFASTGRLDLHCLNEAGMSEFRRALEMDPSIKHPDTLFGQACRAWNWAAATITGWPPRHIEVRRNRDRRALPWSEFPTALKSETEDFLSKAPAFGRKRSLSLETCKSQLDLVRICASILRQSGVPLSEIDGIRALVFPSNFRLILDGLFQRCESRITRLARTKALVLRKIARRSGHLSATELREVEVAFDKVEKEHKAFLKDNPARSHVLLADYSEPGVIDALLQLPGAALASLAGGRVTRSRACTAKCATILALWLEAPLTSRQLRGLRFHAHFTAMLTECEEVLLLSVPVGELGNRTQLDYLLSPDTSRSIIHFRDHYRGKLQLSSSEYLFPGVEGQPLNSGTLNSQMKRFLARELGTRFTPELIRRIATMIALGEEPTAIEAVRGMLGHRTDEMARAAAESFGKRIDHATYLELLISGRLGMSDPPVVGRTRP